jgi:hypothetical protein
VKGAHLPADVRALVVRALAAALAAAWRAQQDVPSVEAPSKTTKGGGT